MGENTSFSTKQNGSFTTISLVRMALVLPIKIFLLPFQNELPEESLLCSLMILFSKELLRLVEGVH